MSVLRIAAACLLDERNRLLVVRKRGTRAFMLPGGKQEPGETPLAALQRELREELELILAPQALRRLGRFQAQAANEPDLRVDADVFTAALRQPVTAAAELEELAWLGLDDPWPANLAPLLREQVIPALLRKVRDADRG